ncbi:MAG: DUF3109 family protein [Saprospiraceae bacterium]|nr:DUF3109 family protein [Saprospiraceae bacterium]
MFIIDNVLISDDVLESNFICALDKCKGACCYEGDFGAPITNDEKDKLDSIYQQVKAYLSPKSILEIEKNGNSAYYREMKSFGTTLMPDGACVYMNKDEHGIAACGIEQAYKAGATDFQKPISCHLYPIRVKENKAQGFTALNYDQWDICKAACSLGESEKLPLFRFVKDALIRRFGLSFYEELEALYKHLLLQKKNPNI